MISWVKFLTLVACKMITTFSYQAWKDKFVAGYVSIAGVFGGSAKAIRAIVSGNHMKILVLHTNGYTVSVCENKSEL